MALKLAQLVPMRQVKQVKVVNDHVIWFRFSDGREGYRDFSDMLAEGGEMVEPCATLKCLEPRSWKTACRLGRTVTP